MTELVEDANVSFKVYSLEDLEARFGDSPPPVIRPSMAYWAPPKGRAPWAPGKRSAAALWAMVLAEVDWKRMGLGLAGGLGTMCLLLFGVIAVAELTDDLKPARASGAPGASVAAPEPPPAGSRSPAPAVSPVATPAPAPAPAPPARLSAARASAKARADALEIFIP